MFIIFFPSSFLCLFQSGDFKTYKKTLKLFDSNLVEDLYKHVLWQVVCSNKEFHKQAESILENM